MTIRTALLSFLLTACGGAAAITSAGDDAGDTPPALDAGREAAPATDAWTDVAVDAQRPDVACGPPTPFGQLACFGHPDAGRAGTSHRDGCDAGDASGCYELAGETPRLWCCPEAP